LASRLELPARRLGHLEPVPAPGATGAVTLRQSLGGLRVLFSQLHVRFRGGVVRGVGGTGMPLRSSRLAGRVAISRKRARDIARLRAAGPDTAASAQLVAYAGDPHRPRPPRRAYVVAVDSVVPMSSDDSPSPLCVVVDAATGEVLDTWRGTIAPSTAKQARRDGKPAARAEAAQTVLAQYEDAKGRTSDRAGDLGSDIWDLAVPVDSPLVPANKRSSPPPANTESNSSARHLTTERRTLVELCSATTSSQGSVSALRPALS
jgi:hypothetical protein